MKNKSIGIYQLITGIFGILLIILNIGIAIENSEIRFTIFLGVVLFSGLAISGYTLIKDYKNSANYAIVAQAMQVFGIVYNGSQYLFTGSAFLSLIYANKGISFNYQILPIAYNISTVSGALPFEMKIFVVPLIFIILLFLKK